MKVLIVGAGIGGLSTYIALHKHLRPLLPSLSLRLVEAYPFLSGSTPSALVTASTLVGAGIGLAPNGFRAIHSLSPSVTQDVSLRAFVDGAHRFSVRTAAGNQLGVLFRGSKERYGGFGLAMVPRGVVFEALLKVVEEIGRERKGEPGEGIEWGRKVVAVSELEADQGVQVEYKDGTKEIVDLVIGADGIKSQVRDSVFHGKYPVRYLGIMGVGGFIPVAHLQPKLRQALLSDEDVVITFGNKGMFGYSLCTPRDAPNEYVRTGPILQWFTCYDAPEPPYTSARAKTAAEADAVKEELLKQYSSWKSPRDEDNGDVGVFKNIIELGCVSEEVKDTLADYHTPLLFLPRFVVPRVESYTTPTGRIILLGDAAHAMPPEGGHGVSCAAEDAVVYSLLLSKLLVLSRQEAVQPLSDQMPEGVLRDAAQGYSKLRMERVGKILDEAESRVNNKKELGTLGQWLRDLRFRLMCLLPESFGDSLYGYDGEKVVNDYLSCSV